MPTESAGLPVEAVLRAAAPHVLARLARHTGDFAAAEDALQEALLAASRSWPVDGLPDQPRGWLFRTAERRFLDQRRSDVARRAREEAVVRERDRLADHDHDSDGADDSLQLLILCCHPALSPASAVALTLRAVGGLTTAEIASAFLVPENTLGTRISRAKQQIRAAGGRFEPPGAAEERDRMTSVRRVLYLMFNEGYAASTSAELQRVAVAAEAIRLTRMVRARRPDDAETAGLLGLMLIIHARRDARSTATGELVPLPAQDRRRWDAAMTAEGLLLVDEAFRPAMSGSAVGEYQLQAAIAAEHARVLRRSDVDWGRIGTLYGLLERVTGNPVVSLNRAVAVAMADGPDAGLVIVDRLGVDHDQLPRQHRWWAVRAHLLEQAGRPDEAREHYREAAARATNTVEQRYLTAQLGRLRRIMG